MSITDLVTIDPDILGGTPVFKGTRVPVKTLFEYLERDYSLEEFLECSPSVTRELASQALDQDVSSNEARFSLLVSGAGGEEREVEAVIDTGFNGFLTLPPEQVAALALPRLGEGRAILANGRSGVRHPRSDSAVGRAVDHSRGRCRWHHPACRHGSASEISSITTRYRTASGSDRIVCPTDAKTRDSGR
jgi:uncharacterized protein (DUF433 family)